MKFKLNIEGIVENIASRGIQMVDPIKINPEDLAGLDWNLKDFSEPSSQLLVPRRSFIYENMEGQSSLRFTGYDKKQTDNESEVSEEYCLMNFDNDKPICDTESELEDFDLDLEETIGYSLFDDDPEIAEDIEIPEEPSYKTEETHTSLEQIVNKKFTEVNLQEQVDDMLIECMLNLGMNYEDAYNKLEQYFNLPLVSDIINGKNMLSDFFKTEQSYMDDQHSGDSFLSCEQRGCLHGDASWLESKNQSASSSDKQRLSFTPPETHVSEFYEGTVKLEKVGRDMGNGSGVMCCQCTTGQEDENLSYESGGSLILKPNDTVLLADADLGCSPETLVSKPEQKASPSCLQCSHCSLSFSSTHLVEEKIPLKNSNSRSGNKKNVDIASSVPTKDSKIVEDPQPFTGRVMDESCYAIDSGTANVSSILHKNESCDPIPRGNFKDFYAPDQFRNLEFGQLCYNPINVAYRDVPFSKTLGSSNELEQIQYILIHRLIQ